MSNQTVQNNVPPVEQPTEVNSYNFLLNTFNMLAKKGTFNLNESAVVYQHLTVIKDCIVHYNTVKQQLQQQQTITQKTQKIQETQETKTTQENTTEVIEQ